MKRALRALLAVPPATHGVADRARAVSGGACSAGGAGGIPSPCQSNASSPLAALASYCARGGRGCVTRPRAAETPRVRVKA